MENRMTDVLTGLRSLPDMSAADMSRWTEHQWIEERIKVLRAELAEIVKCSQGDNDTENGIMNLQAAIDDFASRRDKLDEGD